MLTMSTSVILLLLLKDALEEDRYIKDNCQTRLRNGEDH